MIKWIGVGLGTILGISHIGMIGYIATVNKEQGLPKLDIPVTPYTCLLYTSPSPRDVP